MNRFNHFPPSSGNGHHPQRLDTNGHVKPILGIAFSGGVVRGFVHIGVLQALEEARIPISLVGGASAGALIGYCFAAGLKASHLIEISKNLKWFRFLRPTFSRRGFFTFKPMEKWLINIMEDLDFSELVRPLVVAATDLDRGESVLIHSGKVARAIHASCAVPGFIKPVALQGKHLVDGGVTNNLPVDAVRQMGANYVIGVDVFDPHPIPILGPISVGMRAAQILVRNTNNGRKGADCLISPDLSHFSFARFREKERLIEAGYEATWAKIPEIKEILEHGVPLKKSAWQEHIEI